MANLRLANAKTRKETGLDYVVNSINIQTPFGKKLLKELKPFYPGEEEELRCELQKCERVLEFVKADKKRLERTLETFMEMKDISFTLERSGRNTLSVVELFEIKNMLLLMEKLQKLMAEAENALPEEFVLEPTEELLDILDPSGERINTFYVYDEFSEKLAELRKRKRELEIAVRREQKQTRDELRNKFGINLTPKFDITVSKANAAQLEKLQATEELEQSTQDYMSVTFVLKATPAVYELQKELEELNISIDEEEEAVRERLSRRVADHAEVVAGNCRRIGRFDFHIAKAVYADEHSCVRPEITDEHLIEFREARHIQVEDILKSKGKEYCPISVELKEGVTCITGANMGGKTVSLKLTGLIAILAQYGFFVPCESARVGLSSYMQILIGDSQSVERGLSSFGSEMEELKEIMDNGKNRSLLLIDEIASGTNPVEATALTRAIVDYLRQRPYITLMTTHFDAVTLGQVVNLQVTGLSGTDFGLLDKELRYANRKERINIIGRYMDYRLRRVENGGEVPKDALNIARMLGIDSEIIDKAKEYITLEDF